LIEPPWEELDPEIRPIVEVFFDEGLSTINSCHGHGRDDPWIVFMPIQNEAGAIDLWKKVRKVAFNHGWTPHSEISMHNAEYEQYGPGATRVHWWVEIRWWGRVPFRVLG
jgi:hypothetical protein